MPTSRPAPPVTYTPHVLNLIQSSAYPPLPEAAELEYLLTSLRTSAATVTAELEKRQRKIQKRKEREEEQAALEANEKAGAKLEALERARVEGQKTKESPTSVRVKKERTSLSPVPSNASSASFKPQHNQPITYASGHNKKKKKRVLDSDDDMRSRDRSATIPSPPPLTSGLKLKLSSSQPQSKSRPDFSPTPSTSTAAASAVIGSHIDFSLPTQPGRPLIPPRPGVQKPVPPGPKKQSEVDEDYSNVKAPTQVAFTTFWSGVEPYLREIREDDLAMLNFKADAPESYEIPPRGRHYTEIWDEEDGLPAGTTPRYPVPNLRQGHTASHGALSIPHYVPSAEMRDENLVDEQRGLGSLTERIVAAVVGDKTTSKYVRRAVSGREVDEEASSDEPTRMDVVNMEDRMKKELRAVMLLGDNEEFDAQARDDDEVTSALRQCQRLLYLQTSINEARKSRLAEIARQRLAYGDYTSALDGLEKSIESSWARRVKKFGLTPKKPIPGSVPGLNPNRPPVPINMKRLVAVRKEWLDTVGKIMRERPTGEVIGLPQETIYDGIGEEAEEKDERDVDRGLEVDDASGDE
ncbi:histone acetyltransferases subunit 3-domain-containing protein [Kockovaella imperatae]|uniref:Histone acetyltransferases subunit 3-domain-containing protein n=1 Tax=Kockovaella imperatae TaxID=4999 RepID=A0A1Y1U7B6_9TREE|nr:histone acetyltransferases subunit 3-domain-containing protein [Kockovaella imperatae]ORX33921.1 histone acetyltransferases subunit 3-domain-containing protein [Kockovaella imperatae]